MPLHRDSDWKIKDTLTALLVVLVWGINFVPMKFGLAALSPLELGLARYLFASIPLCFFIRFPTVRLRWVVLLALFQGVGQFSLLFVGLQVGMTASLASVMLQTQIYFTALWSFLLYRQRPTLLLWLSMGTATIGLLFFSISALQDDGVKAVTMTGIGYVLGAAAMWGAANLISRQAQHESPSYNALGLIVWSSVIAVLVYLLLLIAFVPDVERWLDAEAWATLTTKVWLSLAYLGWISTLAGYALWTLLLKRHAPNQVAPFSLGVPVVGLAAGLLWLKEPIDIWQWTGSVFVGLSLVLVVFGPRWLKNQKVNFSKS